MNHFVQQRVLEIAGGSELQTEQGCLHFHRRQGSTLCRGSDILIVHPSPSVYRQ